MREDPLVLPLRWGLGFKVLRLRVEAFGVRVEEFRVGVDGVGCTVPFRSGTMHTVAFDPFIKSQLASCN